MERFSNLHHIFSGFFSLLVFMSIVRFIFQGFMSGRCFFRLFRTVSSWTLNCFYGFRIGINSGQCETSRASSSIRCIRGGGGVLVIMCMLYVMPSLQKTLAKGGSVVTILYGSNKQTRAPIQSNTFNTIAVFNLTNTLHITRTHTHTKHINGTMLLFFLIRLSYESERKAAC